MSNASKYDLSQNYPNPFNPITKIDYQVSQDSKVMLKIYDITGKEVMTLVNTQQNAGYYTVQFDASNLSSGNYFYKLIASSNGNETVITKKMTVIK
ncbi:MAG TPA: T9SS type A sorting domain-containing protein [Ignavibacteria bacterium]